MLATVLLMTLLLTMVATTILRMLRRGRHTVHGAALEVYVNTTLIFFGLILQSKVAADLFDPGFNLLHMIAAVIPLAHNDMQVIFASTSRSFDALLKHILSFLNKQTVQVDGIVLHTAIGVVLKEDEVPRLTVVLLHFRSMLFPFLGQFMCACAIARFIGLVCAIEARASLRCFLTGEITETIVLCFGVVVGVIEGWEVLVRFVTVESGSTHTYSANPLRAFP